MTPNEIYAKAYQLLVNTVDPLESGGYHFYNTTADLLAITSAYNQMSSATTLNHIQALLKDRINYSLQTTRRLVLTIDEGEISIRSQHFRYWSKYRWEIDNTNTLYIGTRVKV